MLRLFSIMFLALTISFNAYSAVREYSFKTDASEYTFRADTPEGENARFLVSLTIKGADARALGQALKDRLFSGNGQGITYDEAKDQLIYTENTGVLFCNNKIENCEFTADSYTTTNNDLGSRVTVRPDRGESRDIAWQSFYSHGYTRLSIDDEDFEDIFDAAGLCDARPSYTGHGSTNSFCIIERR